MSETPNTFSSAKQNKISSNNQKNSLMKTINLKSVIVTLSLILSIAFVNAQDQRTCTVIDVNGGVYFDRTWLFSVPGTTQAFDNGWDSYKFLTAASAVPQIYVVGTDGNFQVGTVGNANNTVIGFIPGEATEYTLTFTHTDLAYSYQQLFLYDKVADKTVDIYAQGSTYSFTASGSDIKERFVILTAIAETPGDGGAGIPQDTTVVTPPETGNDNGNHNDKDKNHKKDKKDKKGCKENKANNVKVYSHHKKIMVNNPNKQNGRIKVINARTGKVIKDVPVAAETTTTIDTNTQAGTYVIVTTVDVDTTNTTVFLE